MLSGVTVRKFSTVPSAFLPVLNLPTVKPPPAALIVEAVSKYILTFPGLTERISPPTAFPVLSLPTVNPPPAAFN